MDTISVWLQNLNLFQVGLTAFFSAYITIRSNKRNFEKGVQTTQQARNEITSELRGQIDSIRKKEQ